MRKVDVVVVGGGPAGLASAIEVSRRGLSVIVIERQGPTPDKACGEGLMPTGWRALDALGAAALLPPEAKTPFCGIRYLQENGTILTGRFRHGQGVAIRRLALSAGLEAAARQQGVEVRHNVAARDVRIDADRISLKADEAIEARFLVAADGLASPLRKQAGLDGPVATTRRFGLRQHFQNVKTSEFVDVHWCPDAEAYVTPLSGDRCGVAFLFDAGRLEKPTFELLLSRFPVLQEQLARATPDSELRGSGPLRRHVRGAVSGRLILVGDAAGYVDAITGEGLSLAFEGARALGGALKACVDTSNLSELAHYERAHARLFRRYMLTAGGLVMLARHPRIRRALFNLCGVVPGLFEGALQLVSGSAGTATDSERT
jgi:menaquinone-9 beta-reductase